MLTKEVTKKLADIGSQGENTDSRLTDGWMLETDSEALSKKS